MSDDIVNPEMRWTVTTEFMRKAADDNEKRRELEAAVERVRALHEPIARDIPKCVTCKDYAGYHVDLPCPTLRALGVGRE